MRRKILVPLITLFLATYGEATFAQQVTSPERHFGFRIGDDYMLANYKQMESYFLKVAQESDRVLIREAGLTEEGRKQYLLIVSSPENLKHIEKYRGISQRLGRAEGLTDSEALQLAKEGKIGRASCRERAQGTKVKRCRESKQQKQVRYHELRRD